MYKTILHNTIRDMNDKEAAYILFKEGVPQGEIAKAKLALAPEALALLDGVVDIYMPDMKYGDSQTAHRYSHVRNYWEVNQAAVREMHRQVGDLTLDEHGLARRGLLVRHLVLPGDLANTETVLAFLAREISTDTWLNLMDQYHPCYKSGDYPPLDRPLAREEYEQALGLAEKYGLRRLDQRRRWREWGRGSG